MLPGEGAIKYAREVTRGMGRLRAAEVIATIREYLPDDPQVKFCVNCGFPFRDMTRPGNAKVCGISCKIDRKSAQKAIQRANIAATMPPKVKKAPKYDENGYMMRVWRMETPKSPEKLEQISAARQRYNDMGGRKKPIREVDY